MKMRIFFLAFFELAFGLSGCDHCIKLCQYNFDYVPLLQDDYCQSDVSCENFLREVSFRYLSGKIQSNPCIYEGNKMECVNFSVKICSDIVQNSCSKGPGLEKSGKFEYQSIEEEEKNVREELKQEIVREKQRYLKIINRLNELQLELD